VLSRGTRARNVEAKAARSRAIVGCARRLLEQRPYAEISLDDVARKLHISKAALYLYFPSREALFLEVLSEDLEQWLIALEERLDRPGPWTASSLAEQFLVPGPKGLCLMPLLHTILERKAGYARVLEFRRMMMTRFTALGAALEGNVPFLPPGSSLHLVVCTLYILLGFRLQADFGPITERVFRLPELRMLKPELNPMMREVLTAVIGGWGAERTRPQPRRAELVG
jgi:AcrR family transcriptional regulator